MSQDMVVKDIGSSSRFGNSHSNFAIMTQDLKANLSNWLSAHFLDVGERSKTVHSRSAWQYTHTAISVRNLLLSKQYEGPPRLAALSRQKTAGIHPKRSFGCKFEKLKSPASIWKIMWKLWHTTHVSQFGPISGRRWKLHLVFLLATCWTAIVRDNAIQFVVSLSLLYIF